MYPQIKRISTGTLAMFAIFSMAQACAGVLYGLEYHQYTGHSGHPTDSNLEVGTGGYFDAVCYNDDEIGRRTIIYPFDIPNGFEIVNVTVWGKDSSPTRDLGYRLVETCQPFISAGTPFNTNLALASSGGSAGLFILGLNANYHVAQSSSCSYFLEARFAPDDGSCVGSDLASRNVRLLLNNPDVIFRHNMGP